MQEDGSSDFVDAPSEQEESALRLRIHHLMLWMLCSAIVLTFENDSFAADDLPAGFQSYMLGSQLVGGILGGSALAGAIAIAYERYRNGRNLPREPGHWLLVVQGISLLGTSLGSDEFSTPLSQVVASVILMAITQMISALLYLFASKGSSTQRWQQLFKALFVLTVLSTIFVPAMLLVVEREVNIDGLYWTVAIANGLLGIVFMGCYIWSLVVVITDWREGLSYDWLHWLGIFNFIIGPLIGILFGLFLAIAIPFSM